MAPIMCGRVGAAEYGVLAEISAGDLFVGFLLSGHSSRTMFRRARESAQQRARARYEYLARLKRMQKKGLVELLEEKEGIKVRITETGIDELQVATLRKQPRPDVCDGKWRMVSFDIPNDHNELRHELRRLLQRIGFVHMQQSVYVFPYAVAVLDKLFARRAFPLSQVAYSTVETLAQDAVLRKYFKVG
jgi:CRISPR/Cas system-associated endoribonuclease Cas2